MFNEEHFNYYKSNTADLETVKVEKIKDFVAFFNSQPDIAVISARAGRPLDPMRVNMVFRFSVLPSGFEKIKWIYQELTEHLLKDSILKCDKLSKIQDALLENSNLTTEANKAIYEKTVSEIMPNTYSTPEGISLSINTWVLTRQGSKQIANHVMLKIGVYYPSNYEIAYRVLRQCIEKYKLLHY